jgi:hypothetical protein
MLAWLRGPHGHEPTLDPEEPELKDSLRTHLDTLTSIVE